MCVERRHESRVEPFTIARPYTYRLTRIGYEGGKLALVELLNARRALTDARTQMIDAATERLSAQAALARLAGVPPFGDQP